MITNGLAILTAEETRAAEQALFDAGTDPYALMCRAAAGAAEIVWRAGHRTPTLVLCGPGNNGGDGFVIARLLRDRGVPVRVAALGESRTDSSQRARADWGAEVEDLMSAAPAAQIVDALFGIGLARGLDDAVAHRLSALVAAAQRSIAVDLPSGVDTDRAIPLSAVSSFDITVALGALKPAHVLQPSAGRCGRIAFVPIGLSADDATCRTLMAPQLAAPTVEDHKYTRGLVTVVAGAMPGAAALSAEAAARGGAGYVRLVGAQAVHSTSHAIVRATVRTPGALDDPRIAAMLIGPGLGGGGDAGERLREALAPAHATVIDADGLLALGEIGMGSLPDRAILTPHAGEFAALFGAIDGNRIDQAREAARRSGAVVLLKGYDSVIAAPDGRCRVSAGASTWLSTAGTGDVLAGLCAARLAVGGDPFLAACEALWLQGEAARRAGAAFAADDLIAHVPAAIAGRL